MGKNVQKLRVNSTVTNSPKNHKDKEQSVSTVSTKRVIENYYLEQFHQKQEGSSRKRLILRKPN